MNKLLLVLAVLSFGSLNLIEYLELTGRLNSLKPVETVVVTVETTIKSKGFEFTLVKENKIEEFSRPVDKAPREIEILMAQLETSKLSEVKEYIEQSAILLPDIEDSLKETQVSLERECVSSVANLCTLIRDKVNLEREIEREKFAMKVDGNANQVSKIRSLNADISDIREQIAEYKLHTANSSKIEEFINLEFDYMAAIARAELIHNI